MNVLINTNRHVQEYPGHKEEQFEKRTFGDMIAVSILGFYTMVAIVVSSWSAFELLWGNPSDGGPIGLLFKMMVNLT